MNPIQRTIRAIDDAQRRTPPVAFIWAVVKKFGNDQAGSLAALVAYYGFLSLFPLLLVLVTILGLIVTPHLRHLVLHSAIAQFPIVGTQLTGPNGIHALKEGSVVGLVIGLLGLVWGATGICQAAQNAMARVWNVPQVDRPNYLVRLLRSGAFLGVLLLDVVVTTVLAGITTFGGGLWYARIGAGLLTILVDVALYVLAFRILTPGAVPTRDLVLGAVLAGVAWAILQYVGTFLVGHQLRHSRQIYGYFASVLGLLAFLYTAAQVTLYAAEANVVRARKLWPRSLTSPPLTEADRTVLVALAQERRQLPQQQVKVGFEDAGTTTPDEPPSIAAPDEAPSSATPEARPSTAYLQAGSPSASPEPGAAAGDEPSQPSTGL
jgi:YihY family inner membrane protein